jgi:hypothetical protein
VGTLATIAGDVARAGLGAPAVLVVGEVVGLRKRLRWFDTLFATESTEGTEGGTRRAILPLSEPSVPAVAET